MKFKKALVVILALAMVVTLMPTAAFATTTNTVTKVPVIGADKPIGEASVTFEVKDSAGWTAGTKNVFEVSLENGTFDKVLANVDSTTGQYVAESAAAATSTGYSVKLDSVGVVKVTKVVTATKKSLELEVETVAAPKGATFSLVFKDGFIKAKDVDGPVKMKVDGEVSAVSSSELTIARVAEGKTVATVIDNAKTFAEGTNNVEAAELRIKEATVGAIDTGMQIIKLSLPKGTKWADTPIKDKKINGNLMSATDAAVKTSLTDLKAATDNAYYIDTDNSRLLYLALKPTPAADNLRSVNFVPVIKIDKNAAEGDVTVDISSIQGGISDASGLLVAKIGVENVTVTTVEEKDLPTIVSGKTQTKDGKYFWVEVQIKESVKDSLTWSRSVDFELPSYAQVAANEIRKTNEKGKLKDAASYSTVAADFDDGWALNKDTSKFSIDVDKLDPNQHKADTIKLYIPLTIKADYTGDVKLKVKGAKAGVTETELTVAKAVAPITVETKVTKVINGAQKQALADIVIKENVAGYLNDESKNNYLNLTFDTLGLTNGFSIDNAKVAVTEGNIDIDSKVDIKNADTGKISNYAADGKQGLIALKVKEASTKPSTIKISGVTASLSRLLPEGEYKLEVFGSALENNTKYNDSDFNVPTVKVAYVNIATAADTQQAAVNSKFVIGEMKFTVNDVEQTMDVAPFIDANNRTMVPIRYVANALGVADSNITYDNASTTATISGPSNVVNVRTGSKVLVASTGNITMDTTAVNSNGRLYVPVRFIANALGAEVSWDPATKTVAVFTSSK